MINRTMRSISLSDSAEARAEPADGAQPKPTHQAPEYVRLADGALVCLRDAAPADADGLRRMFFQLGDTTRYRYFFVAAPNTPDWAERVVALGAADGARSYALVAELGADLLGVARFDCAKDGVSAEIGGLFVDAWQSRGLGGYAIARLGTVARLRGITALTAHMLGENDRALRLVRRTFPNARVHWEQGVYDARIELALAPDPSPEGRGGVGG